MGKTWLAVKGWNSFPVWFLQDVLMEVEDQLAAPAPSNVGLEKEIATVMPTVLATWNAARATVWMTTVTLPLDFRLTTTAAMTPPATPTVSNIKASYHYFHPKVWLFSWIEKGMEKTWLAVKGWNSFPVCFLQDALMEVEDLVAAPAPSNVG